MKKLWFIFFSLLFVACNNSEKKDNSSKDSLINNAPIVIDSSLAPIDTIVAATKPSLLELNQLILRILKEKNYAALPQHIHPSKGLRFTPYGMVNFDEDVVVEKVDFLKMMKSNKKIIWGHFDGTGDIIELSLKDYFGKFVYDADFLNAEKVTINTSSSTGNSINNISTVYPNSDYVENYFSGFNKEYDGMDWRALRLVFKTEGSETYLIGIIHDQWTT